ncbi:MAG: hypothetical protein QM541_05750 [Flavobacterium sp.]|nr:hypothetical protein [Flavobacterium sp.]
MSVVTTNTPLEDEILSAVKQLSVLEQQIMLKNIRLRKYVNKKVKPLANYDMSIIKPPTMAQIDKWKHEARKAAKEKEKANAF